MLLHIKKLAGPFALFCRIWNGESACETIIGLNDKPTHNNNFLFLQFNVDDEFYRFHIKGTALTLTLLFDSILAIFHVIPTIIQSLD